MIAFNKYYDKFNILSITLVIVSLFLLTFKGLNFGIDFKGGTLIELRSSDNKINVSSLRENLNTMNLGDVSVKNFGNELDFLIKFENNSNKNIINEIKINQSLIYIKFTNKTIKKIEKYYYLLEDTNIYYNSLLLFGYIIMINKILIL